ncbi:MAG: hypothetical protein AAFP86_05815, partial [Planctomycetota bacterium]
LFERVYGGQDIQLTIGANAARNHGPTRQLLYGMDTVEVRAVDVVGDRHDLGTIVGRANHPFLLKGRVVLADSRNRRRAPEGRARFEAKYVREVERFEGKWGLQTRPLIEIDRETGVFTVYSDTPKPPISLRAFCSGARKDATATFHPEPDTTVEGVELVLEL